MKKVMVFGTFDGLHPGHLDFFKQALHLSGSGQAKKYLIVSVATDKNVGKFKGKRPLFSQKERLELIRNLKLVDTAVLGAEENFYSEIKKYRPDVICLGYDQWANEDEVKKELKAVGLPDTKVVRLQPYKVDRAKSTELKKRSVDF